MWIFHSLYNQLAWHVKQDTRADDGTLMVWIKAGPAVWSQSVWNVNDTECATWCTEKGPF
jgi:hypothetical protein